jgi:hypothetical protein
MGRRRGLVIETPPRDGQLTVVRVDDTTVTLSTGEVLLARFEKLRHLAEQLCQEGVAVVVRTWPGRDGIELIELYRATSWTTGGAGSGSANEVF